MARNSFLDRAIGAIAPGWAENRARARFRLARVERARAEYDGATKGRRAEGWRRRGTDANSEIGRAQKILRDTARDMVRNNGYAARAVSVLTANTIGAGVTFQVKRDGKVDAKLQAIAKKHLESTDIDADGRHDIYGLQQLAFRAMVEGGAGLVRFRQRRLSDGFTLPFQLQVLEPDYLDDRKHGAITGGGSYIYGVQFNAIGARTAYWLFSDHPGSSIGTTIGSKPTPARDVIHLFRADRPGQQHGVSWFAPVILRARDFADFEDAELVRQKIAACHVGVVTGEDDLEIAAASEGQAPDVETMEPGMVWHARDGRNITFNSPPQTNSYAAYTKVSLKAIAVGLNVSAHSLTGDLSDLNYSSGRLGWLDDQRQVDSWQWQTFIPQFCAGVGSWLLRVFDQIGEDVTGVTVDWMPPRRAMINPSEEVKANRDAIRSGQRSWTQVVRENGDDPEQVAEEMAQDNARFDKLGLILDCDPRRVTSVGNPTDANGGDGPQGKDI
jgi:lambda family phage portal protein